MYVQYNFLSTVFCNKMVLFSIYLHNPVTIWKKKCIVYYAFNDHDTAWYYKIQDDKNIFQLLVSNADIWITFVKSLQSCLNFECCSNHSRMKYYLKDCNEGSDYKAISLSPVIFTISLVHRMGQKAVTVTLVFKYRKTKQTNQISVKVKRPFKSRAIFNTWFDWFASKRGAPVLMTITISYIEQSTTNLLVHWYFMPSNNTGAPITLYYDCIKIVVSHLHFRSSALILDFLPFLHSINVTSTVVWVHKN